MKKYWVISYPLSAQRRLIRLGGCPDWSASSLGALTIFDLSCCGAHENSEECVDLDQTPPSPVFTLFFYVLFHRTLKTLYYTYLRFAVAVFLSHLLLNICIGLLETELNYRELYPLAWEVWKLDSNFCSQSYGHCPINIAGAFRVLSAPYNVCYPPKRRAIIQKRITVRTFFKTPHDTLDLMLSLHGTGITSLIPLVLFNSPILAKIKYFFCIYEINVH